MASSRAFSNPQNVTDNTYDSAGGKDYDDLGDWENDTDVNCVGTTTSYRLNVYKGAHNDVITMAGATTDSSYFRILRAATGEGHSGVPKLDGTIAAITSQATILIGLDENYDEIQDLVIKNIYSLGSSTYGIRLMESENKAIGCIAFECDNPSVGDNCWPISMFKTGQSGFAINCMAIDNGQMAFASRAGTLYAYNGTISGSGDDGLWAAAGQTIEAKNVINLDGENVAGTINKTTCSVAANFRDSANDDYHLDESDTVNMHLGTDLSGDSDFDFDDDINDKVMGAGKSGQVRNDWDIGADQYNLDHDVNGVVSRKFINGVDSEDIASFNGIEN